MAYIVHPRAPEMDAHEILKFSPRSGNPAVDRYFGSCLADKSYRPKPVMIVLMAVGSLSRCRADGVRLLFLQLRRPPLNSGRDALRRDDLPKLGAELSLGRIERTDDVEPGVERGAEPGGVSAAIDRALGRVERFR